MLRSRTLQHVLSVVPSTLALRRLEHWLAFRLAAPDLQHGCETPTFAVLLDSLLAFCEVMQVRCGTAVVMPVVIQFYGV